MKIALVQGRVHRDRPADNLEHVKTFLDRPEMAGVDLVVFPALILSGRLGPEALGRPGLDVQYTKVFKDFLEISASRPDPALALSALVWPPEGGPAREEVLAVRGGRVFPARPRAGCMFELAGRTVALGPGPDGWLPEEVEAADVLVSFQDAPYRGTPYAPPSPGPARAWRLNVGAVGAQGPRVLEGATWVVDPAGRLKGWAAGFDTAVIILDTDSTHLPTLEPPDRQPLAVLHQALTAGLADYVRSTGCGRVLVGLSGGLDSAVTALLAVDALGPENVLGVALPSEYNAPESLSLARELARNLKISFLTIPIDAIRESFSRSFLLTPRRDAKDGHLADENLQARIRGVLLMYLANREDRLLLATGNKSEAAMGYSTLYGDTCGAIAPIGDVYKTRLYELAEHLNRETERIPRGIITRPPSAELRPGQKDEDSLPPYAVLDDILHRHLEGGRSGSQVAREGGHSALTVAWVLGALKKSAFKRAQEPFSLVASTHPLAGLDWPE